MNPLLEARMEYTYKAGDAEISNILLVFKSNPENYFVVEHYHRLDKDFVGGEACLRELTVAESGLPGYMATFWNRCLETEDDLAINNQVSPRMGYVTKREFEIYDKEVRERVLELINPRKEAR